MAKLSRRQKAINAINRDGIVLVFPIKNQDEPHSLWNELFPKEDMKWEWSDEADDKVPFLWSLMKELSSCGEVVYTKWYQNRATFISKKLFEYLVSYSHHFLRSELSKGAASILEELESNSPLSTKQIKALTDMRGKYFEAEYNRAMRELFHRFLIVGFGEVDDGAFPSSAMGATGLIYEDLWLNAKHLTESQTLEGINSFLNDDNKFKKFLIKSTRNYHR